MNEQDFLFKYWNYYLNLENTIIDLENYITFDERNFNCFSIEFIKMFQTICSEIDVVLKLITSKNEMNEYKIYLLKDLKYKEIKSSQTNLLLNKKINFSPFCLLDENLALDWWKNYNEVKHNRQMNDNYTKATLYNVLQSLSALYILESFFYNISFYNTSDGTSNSIPTPKPKLFSSISNLNDNVVTLDYANIIDEF